MTKCLLIPTCCALLFAPPAFGSDSCSGVKVTSDAFSGGVRAEAVVLLPSQFNALGITLDQRAGANTLRVTVKEVGAMDGQVAPGAEVLIRFENGNVLTLHTTAPATATPYVAGSIVMTNVTYALPLDVASLRALGASPMTLARLPLVAGGATTDWEAKKSTAEKLRMAALCLSAL